MTETGFFTLGDEAVPTQPHKLLVRAGRYNRMIWPDGEHSDREAEIGAWCQERGWRVEAGEHDNYEAIKQEIKQIEIRIASYAVGSPEILKEIARIDAILIEHRWNALYFPSEAAAIEFKVRWL